MIDALFGIPRCICGHHMDAHHTTPKGRVTRCLVWDPHWCTCTDYEPQPEEEDDQ